MENIKHKGLREFINERKEPVDFNMFKIRDADMDTFIIHYLDYVGDMPKGVHESWIYKVKDERDDEFLNIKTQLIDG